MQGNANPIFRDPHPTPIQDLICQAEIMEMNELGSHHVGYNPPPAHQDPLPLCLPFLVKKSEHQPQEMSARPGQAYACVPGTHLSCCHEEVAGLGAKGRAGGISSSHPFPENPQLFSWLLPSSRSSPESPSLLPACFTNPRAGSHATAAPFPWPPTWCPCPLSLSGCP